MAKSRKSLKTPRAHAFVKQQGKCCYCHQPMWLDDPSEFAKKYGIKLKNAKWMQCTGEHLVSHSAGGKADKTNIAAACLFCNRMRHGKRKIIPSPEQYEHIVLQLIRKHGWHPCRLDNCSNTG